MFAGFKRKENQEKNLFSDNKQNILNKLKSVFMAILYKCTDLQWCLLRTIEKDCPHPMHKGAMWSGIQGGGASTPRLLTSSCSSVGVVEAEPDVLAPEATVNRVVSGW